MNDDSIRLPALLIALAGAATILGAFIFQYGFGYQPCPLCLDQRIAYYVSIPLALMIALGAGYGASRRVLALAFAAIGAAMAINVALAAYHAGIEWRWWPGPTECSGPLNSLGSTGGLLQQLNSVRVVRCDEAAWRFLGLSLAGYNVLISLGLAGLAAKGMAAAIRTAKLQAAK
ncbi:MAG TPA: disulfide bond formation protein B [Pseudorhodoplanes sp.]|nr:disulfide bond formation protein B [Pseudorhodoplanes sp.]